MEIVLGRLYQDYVTRHRCIASLEQTLEDAEAAEHERVEVRQVGTTVHISLHCTNGA